MEVNVKLLEWKMVEEKGLKRIAGKYAIMAGATELSKQIFNEGYDPVTVIFSNELVTAVEKITEKISKEIIKHFTGKEE